MLYDASRFQTVVFPFHLTSYQCIQQLISLPFLSSQAALPIMPSEILTSFLGAIQASLSVLLVISYGVIAAQFDILSGDSTKQISALCVRMFLPALMITNVGSQLHADTGIRYVPILCKSITPVATKTS